MKEHEPVFEPEHGPGPEAGLQPERLTADDWELIIESVDDYLRGYTESDWTWWEEDDDRPVRLQALLGKLQGRELDPNRHESNPTRHIDDL